MSRYTKLSQAVKKGTGYRTVIRFIIKFANNEVRELYPQLSYTERIIKAQEEPFWTAAKECRDLSEEEHKIAKQIKAQILK